MPPVRVRYQTIEFDEVDIHVRTLRDNQQFEDTSGKASVLGITSALWPLFGIIWASGEVLAHHMSDYVIEGKRILEVGCGIGLASLVLNHRHADITATDYHPEAAAFMLENVILNKGGEIPFVCTGWNDESTGLGRFDLIIGSDLLYERNHVELLSEFIERQSNVECDVILVDPGRGQTARFSTKMAKFGYSFSQSIPPSAHSSVPFKGKILHYSR